MDAEKSFPRLPLCGGVLFIPHSKKFRSPEEQRLFLFPPDCSRIERPYTLVILNIWFVRRHIQFAPSADSVTHVSYRPMAA
jgi:hypothetical protein